METGDSLRPVPHGWPIYCNRVNDKKIFAEEARDHVARLRTALPLRTTDCVLDFGCGFGYTVELLASEVGDVAFWDVAANVLQLAIERTAHLGNVEVVDLGPGRKLPLRRYDVVVVTSVIQYMRLAELECWLTRWRSMLRPGGRIVVSDVPSPEQSAIAELGEMLTFARRHGILRHALYDGVREAGRYACTRRTADLLRLTPDDLAALAADAGLAAKRLSANLTHRADRFSMILSASVSAL